MNDSAASFLTWLTSGTPIPVYWTILGWVIAVIVLIFLWRRATRLAALDVAHARIMQQLEAFDALRDELALEQEKRGNLERNQVRLETTIAEREKALAEMKTRMENDFQAIASRMLQQSHQTFLERANETFAKQQVAAKSDVGELIKPMRDTLTRYEQGLVEMRSQQAKAQGELSTRITDLALSARNVQAEAARLVTALKSGPKTRGDWGEAQLRNIVEMAGLSRYCDFEEQYHLKEGEQIKRPDMVINLPGGKKLAIDSKVSLNAYLQAVDAESDALREAALLKHAEEIWGHVTTLGRKDYAAGLRKEGSLDFVIMFVPKESFFAAAMESRPTLIEDAFEKKVLIASPANLIAILKSVALVWRQEQATENAERVAALAKDLYESLQSMGNHLGGLGKSLETSVKNYNKVIGSYEGRVLSRARKFAEYELPGTETPLEEIEPIESDIRDARVIENTSPDLFLDDGTKPEKA